MRALVILLLCTLCLPAAANTFRYKGIKRCYLLHVPRCYNKNNPTPLVIALHGGGSSAHGMKKSSKFKELSEKENFIVLYPQAYKRQWNDGRNVPEIPSHRLGIDDVGFINALLDHICAQYNIDRSRVYATGPSNGGFMSNRLGIELSHRLPAIAPMIATLPVNLKKAVPVGPVSVMIVNGTDDPLVPFN